MADQTIEITPESLAAEVAVRRPQGYRFVTVTCVDLGSQFDLFYHLDKEYSLLNLRLRLPKGQPLASITTVYPAAVLVENELKDLFGIEVQGLPLDYKGRFLLSGGCPPAPQRKADPAAAAPTTTEQPAPTAAPVATPDRAPNPN